MLIELPTRSRLLNRQVFVRVRELSIGEFATGIPDVLPVDQLPCFDAMGVPQRQDLRVEWEQWMDAMMAKAIVEPKLSVEQIRLLGPDRDTVGTKILHAWGIDSTEPIQRRFFRKNFLWMVRRLAKHTRRLPTELLQLPTSEFWLNYAILFGEEATETDAQDALMGGGAFS